MMFLPNWSESFPRPLGNLSDLDCIKIAVEAMDEAQRKITFALNSNSSLVSLSITFTPVAFWVSGS